MRANAEKLSETVDGQALDGFAASIKRASRRAVIEEIAQFVETHYCVMDPERPGEYITHEREKHPCEPLAKAIRGLKGR